MSVRTNRVIRDMFTTETTRLLKHKTLGNSGVKSSCVPWYKRQDVWVWVSGMGFIAALMGAMWGLGLARGWDAPSGFNHNESVTSQERFLPEPFIEEEGVRGRYGPGCVGRWYYWKLKPNSTHVWSHVFPWVGYVTHQIYIWVIIYLAQMAKALEPGGPGRYNHKLNIYNWLALGGNICFHLLHLLNTHTTYDATAPYVSISTSQASVIMLTVLIILIEYKERGLFFGWPTAADKGTISRKLRLDITPINVMRRYHGYAFAWGAVYTFWYHPMENTLGHTLGFIYTWMFMLQGSLMYTGVHLNKYWRLSQEIWVALHGGLVAYQTGGPSLQGTTLWPMFVFGFTMVFVLTQIFSLPLWSYIPKVCRLLPLAVYLAITVWAYSWIPDSEGKTWVRLMEIIRIPPVYYISVPLAWLCIWLFLKIENKTKAGQNMLATRKPSPLKSGLYLGAAMLVYGANIGMAIAVEILDVRVELTILMIVFTLIYVVGACVSTIILRQVVPYRIVSGEKVENEGIDNEACTEH